MSKLRNSENWILAGIFGMFGAGAGFYAYHLEEAPFSRRRRLMVIDREKMKEIGDYLFSIDMELYGDKILPANSAEHKRVHAVASRLLEANLCEEAKDINWTITILDDPIINAFVMPSGQIVVFTGMLELMKTDDMLAAILGHEMAHAIMGHMVRTVRTY
jgi:Zn-dependent protease with chaperone function